MKLPTVCGVALCKALRLGARLLRRGGTAAPGRIALRLCPQMLAVMARGVEIVVVTGTNGKTTSSRILEEAFRLAGRECLANRSGANLLSGITTEFAMNSTIFGRCRKRTAVIECDEAAARLALGQLRPRAVLVTNLFRDQLDRYGEVTHTLSSIREGLKNAPEARLVLNADCSLTASLAGDLPNETVFFGVEAGAAPAGAKPPELSDAARCIRCGAAYEYDYVTYAHLGGFRCPACGYRRQRPDVGVEAISGQDAGGSRIELRAGARTLPVRVALPALYNVYNAAGAVAAATAMGLDAQTAAEAAERFHCGFGRMEPFALGKAGATMLLVKNPTGCNQVLDYLAALREDFELVLCLNDRSADGTDVSWIWDADFERLAELGERLAGVTVAGVRAADLAVRLKYAGVDEARVVMQRDYEALAERLAGADKPIYIVPTYTAMLEMRAVLVKKCGGSDFWEG